jgi:chromosome segregation ATPase
VKTIPISGFLALIAMLVCTAQAQTQRSGNDSTRIMQQLQQVTAEKSKLQQDNDSLKKELEALKAKSAQAGAEQVKLQQRARELEQASNQLQGKVSGNDEALEKSRAQLQELIGKYREIAQTLKEVETERDGLRTVKATQERDLTACVDKNAQMYLLSNEILGHLEDQGVWSALKRKEPFTQLSRTRLENLVDDYRYRVDELKLAGKSAATAKP